MEKSLFFNVVCYADVVKSHFEHVFLEYVDIVYNNMMAGSLYFSRNLVWLAVYDALVYVFHDQGVLGSLVWRQYRLA